MYGKVNRGDNCPFGDSPFDEWGEKRKDEKASEWVVV